MTELGVLLSNVGIELEGDAANPRQAAFQIGIVGHPEVLLASDDNGAHSFPKALCASRASVALRLIETHRACDGRSQSCAQTVTKPAIAFTDPYRAYKSSNCNKVQTVTKPAIAYTFTDPYRAQKCNSRISDSSRCNLPSMDRVCRLSSIICEKAAITLSI